MAANASNWKIRPFTSGISIPYTANFTEEEYKKLCKGLIPKIVGDKWFIHFESPYLFLHRSWTGYPMFRVRFLEDGKMISVAEALWASEWAVDKEDKVKYQSQLLDFLISNLLLGKSKPFPKQPGLEKSMQGLFQHAVAGTGYKEKSQEPNDDNK